MNRPTAFGESFGWWLVLVALSLLSWIASTEGLLGMLGEDRPAGVLVVYALWGIFQIGMAKAVVELSSPNTDFRKRPLYLAIYLTVLPFSVILSISFYFALFGAEEFGEDIFRSNLERLQTLTESTRQSYVDVGREMMLLADAARTAARIEAEGPGGTCPTAPGRGRGSAYHKRNFEQAHFGNLAGSFSRRGEGLEDVQVRLIQLEGNGDLSLPDRLAQLRLLQAELNRIQSDVQAIGLPEQIRNHRRWETLGYPTPDSDEFEVDFARFAGFPCEDPQTLALLNNVLRFNLPVPEEVEIQRFDPTNRSDVNNVVANDVLNALISLISGGSMEGSAVLTDQRYRIPIALGMFVDGWLFLIGLAIGIGQNRQRPKSGIARVSKLFTGLLAVKEFDSRGDYRFLSAVENPASPQVKDGVVFIKQILDRVLVESGEHSYLFMPREHAEDIQIGSEKGRRFVELLKHTHSLLTILGYTKRKARRVSVF